MEYFLITVGLGCIAFALWIRAATKNDGIEEMLPEIKEEREIKLLRSSMPDEPLTEKEWFEYLGIPQYPNYSHKSKL